MLLSVPCGGKVPGRASCANAAGENATMVDASNIGTKADLAFFKFNDTETLL